MRCGDYNFMIIEILLKMSVIFQNGTLECVYIECVDDGFFIQNCFRDFLLGIAAFWLPELPTKQLASGLQGNNWHEQLFMW